MGKVCECSLGFKLESDGVSCRSGRNFKSATLSLLYAFHPELIKLVEILHL